MSLVCRLWFVIDVLILANLAVVEMNNYNALTVLGSFLIELGCTVEGFVLYSLYREIIEQRGGFNDATRRS